MEIIIVAASNKQSIAALAEHMGKASASI
jgi:hypothetical protein